MDVTNSFIHIMNDWNAISNRVNDVLRYNLQINRHEIALNYTKVNGLGNQLSITWFPLNRTQITLNFDIKKSNEQYFISTYIPNEYFPLVKYSFDFSEEKPVNSFISTIFERILTAKPVTYDYDQYRQDNLAMHFKDDSDKPFYRNMSRKNISDKMERKIRRKFSDADIIIAFCHKHNQTLCFTSDIAQAKDFITDFNKTKLMIENQ